MTRIIGGSAGGRRLETPRGANTRPTSDRVREALFSAIESWCGSLSGLAFLDLYAGSGAVGLEAWSRGASLVTLVEQDRRTANLISANAKSLGFPEANVVAADVAKALIRSPPVPFDVIFSDPPYDLSDSVVHADLEMLLANGWASSQTLIVVERSSRGRGGIEWPSGVEAGALKRYGETSLWFAHVSEPPYPADEKLREG
jgi:16S rRNA (guanine966-N2)-methyltransferase